MIDTNTIVLGVLIILAFLWRFARTRNLYLTSVRIQVNGLDPIPFKPHDVRSFIQQALLGNRTMKPGSFFIRAFVFVIVAFGLLPFKDYEPVLYWLVILLVALYAPWCILHGLLLKRRY
jgi:hypothetical protein